MKVDIDHMFEMNNSYKNTVKSQLEIIENDHDLAGVLDYLHCIQQHLFFQPLSKTALIYDEKCISYTELAHQVNQMMLALDRLQLKKGAVVAIQLGKSPEYIYSVLACALKGLIWLPIDMDSPALRREYLLANSRVDLVVSKQSIENYCYVLIDEIFSENTHNFSQLSTEKVNPTSLMTYSMSRDAAYYLYTSGSTGTPKCVVLNNRATANVIEQSIEKWQMTADDVIMAVTPFHHDMSVFDVFASMSLGATLVIPTAEQSKNALAWATLVEKNQISIWVSVPAIVDMLCSVAYPAQLQSLRLIAQGGDYIKVNLIEKLRLHLPNARLFSLGGPTETTIWSIWHEIKNADQDIIPYGKALKHNQYFILNEKMQVCQVGEVGRMYMIGTNLSNGYLLDGKISQKDFVPISISVGTTEIAFRMSDLGYVRTDGNIIFAGREEGYLKVKGVRISATEVEMALMKYTPIQEIVIVCCTHPQTEITELVAMFSLTNVQEKIDIQDLKCQLKNYLPHSHIPTKWYCVDHLPLTQNAKIDRKLLQKIAQEQLYPQAQNLKNKHIALEHISDTVMDIFREIVKHEFSSNIFYQTEILRLGIRTKQLKQIAEKISEKYDIRLDFYALASCKTVQDVVNQVQRKRLN